MMKQEDLLQRLKEHLPIIINYEKGFITDEDIKDYATWDKEQQKYTDETGVWDTKLLIDIAKGKVENISLEIGE